MLPKIFEFHMSSSVEIAASPVNVWDLIRAADRWSEWSEVCTQVWNVPTGGIGAVGCMFGFKLRMAGRQVPFNVTVSRVDDGYLIEWHSTKYSITAVRRISVELGESGCRVSDSKYFKSSLLPIGLWYPRGLIRRMTESWLEDMKIEAERSR